MDFEEDWIKEEAQIREAEIITSQAVKALWIGKKRNWSQLLGMPNFKHWKHNTFRRGLEIRRGKDSCPWGYSAEDTVVFERDWEEEKTEDILNCFNTSTEGSVDYEKDRKD